MVSTLSPEYLQYVNNKKIQRLAPESRYRYLRVVNSLLMYTDGDMNREKVVEFLYSLEKKNSSSYVRWAFQVVRGFFKIVYGEEKWKKLDIDSTDLPPKTGPNRPYLETDEAKELMELSRSSPIDYAMFRLALVTGIRKRELRELNLSDYRPPVIRVKTRKHGEERVRTLDEETVNALNNYIAGPRMFWERKYKGRDVPLFLSPRGNRLPDSTLTKQFRKYMRALGKPKGCGMHSLRRTVVTWEAESGMSSMKIQELHGWISSEMPGVYARLKPTKLEEEAHKANPLIEEKNGD